MRSIIRCPNCFTFIYSDARNCHGCGHRIGKRQLLTRGSWIFIILAVAGFTVGRGIDLKQEKVSELNEIERIDDIRKFLRTWLTGPTEQVLAAAGTHKTFGDDLLKLRSRFGGVLPADEASNIAIDDMTGNTHRHASISKVRVTVTEVERTAAPLRASRARKGQGSDERAFTAAIAHGDRRYNVLGRVCSDDDVVLCIEIVSVASDDGGVITPR